MSKWKMVPVEPTKEMIQAPGCLGQKGQQMCRRIWESMVKAAPSPRIPLDPTALGYRLPTAEDAGTDGHVLVWQTEKEPAEFYPARWIMVPWHQVEDLGRPKLWPCWMSPPAGPEDSE